MSPNSQFIRFSRYQRFWSLVIFGALVLNGAGLAQSAAACIRPDEQATNQPAPEQQEPDTVSLPSEVSNRLLRTVARDTRVSQSSLKISAVKQATWDGCMGIAEPEQMCTMIAISGWQVVVTGADQSWVYHLNENGSEIVQNQAASGSRGDVATSFIPQEETSPGMQTATLVMRMTETGGLAGITSEKVLLSDGSILRRQWRGNAVDAAEPVLVKKVSQQQIDQLQQVLLRQQFPNMNGLRFVGPQSLADYPTTTFQALGSTVQFTDLEPDNLPPALRTILQTWQQL